MNADLRPCCQRAGLDGTTPEEHYPVCDVRRDAVRAAVTVRQCQACPHPEVLHAIRSNGSRGGCSVSTGATAEPCGCPGFTPDEPAPTTEEGGPRL